MADIEIHLTVNGASRSIQTTPDRTLLQVLHDDLGLLSVKEGCGQGDCGSCIVILNGEAVNSCLVLAPQVDGSEVLTIEGLEKNGELHPLQRFFSEKWAFQCGYCTPGMLMSCYALLLHIPDPTSEEIRNAISGNLCRCTNYQGVIEAVHATALALSEKGPGND